MEIVDEVATGRREFDLPRVVNDVTPRRLAFDESAVHELDLEVMTLNVRSMEGDKKRTQVLDFIDKLSPIPHFCGLTEAKLRTKFKFSGGSSIQTKHSASGGALALGTCRERMVC